MWMIMHQQPHQGAAASSCNVSGADATVAPNSFPTNLRIQSSAVSHFPCYAFLTSPSHRFPALQFTLNFEDILPVIHQNNLTQTASIFETLMPCRYPTPIFIKRYSSLFFELTESRSRTIP